ncbi:unannotated protein [freshwater metagenome]|uniref:Unannotated protein n=1 Tax=freshwater metagenome TaxID=449393 RepID=A0A6J7S0W3_9ZZZZ
MYAGPIGLIWQLANSRTGGDDQTIESDCFTRGQGDDASSCVERRRCRAQFPINVQFVEVFGFTQRDAVGFPFTRENFLRKWWTIVGLAIFRADDDDSAFVFFKPQSFGCSQTSQRRPNNDHSVQFTHALTVPTVVILVSISSLIPT